MAPQGVKGGRLDWIEAGRGAAAIAVLCSHLPPASRWEGTGPLQLGAIGVQFFFLLSGFIIFHVHGMEIGHPRALLRYAWRRAARIFSTYWLVFTAVLALTLLTVAPPYQPALTSRFFVENLFLTPNAQTFVGPAWTLRHELFFYLMFATLLANVRLGTIVFGLWLLAIALLLPVLGPEARPTIDALSISFHHYNLYFFLGIAVALSFEKGWELASATCSALVSIALWAAWAVEGMPEPSFLSVFAAMAMFTALFYGIVWLSRSTIAAPRMLVISGGASYSIYLINRDAIFFIARLGRRLKIEAFIESWGGFALSALAIIAAGILIYRLCERPMLKWLNNRPWAKRTAVRSAILPDVIEQPQGLRQ